jgi:hypothetical protein
MLASKGHTYLWRGAHLWQKHTKQGERAHKLRQEGPTSVRGAQAKARGQQASKQRQGKGRIHPRRGTNPKEGAFPKELQRQPQGVGYCTRFLCYFSLLLF